MCLVLVVLLGAFSAVGVKALEQRSIQSMLQSATFFSDVVKRATRLDMLHDYSDGVQGIVEAIGRQEAVETIRIYNHAGRVAFSSRPAEIGTSINLQDEVCSGCHAPGRPLDGIRPARCSPIFRTPGPEAHRTVRVINPICNEKTCSSGGCHVHAPEHKVLGVLDVGLSLAGVDRQIQDTSRWVKTTAAVMFLILSAAIGLLTFFLVNRPLSSVLESTRRIAEGDYDQPATLDSRDEIGVLAQSVDQMRRAIREKTDDLEQSRVLFQTLFEQVPCYISVQDRDFKLLNFNDMFKRDFGDRPGEPCYVVYKGRDSICPNCAVEKCFRDGRNHWAEETVRAKDGSQISFLNLATPLFDKQGNLSAVMEVATDVTPIRKLEDELRKSEEKYRLFFNNDPNPIFVLDQGSLEIYDANERAVAMYGYQREALLGRSFVTLTDANDQKRLVEGLAQGEHSLDRVKQIRGDGSGFISALRASYWNYMGQPSITLSAVDITRWLETENQLIQVSKMATLGEMAAGVAHELNQPMSVIGTAGSFLRKQLARERVLPPKVIQEVAEEIGSQVERATRIINHLREFGRKGEVDKVRVQLNEPIQGVFHLLGKQMEVHNVHIELDLDQKLPPIWGDRNRLEQVFINLVMNARDAIEARRAKEKDGPEGLIRITSTHRDGQVVVSVSDNGIGVPPENRERIFEPFFTTKQVGKGTGLGLSISYAIIRDYGGAIEVESQGQSGSTFRLTFPVAREEKP